MIKHHKCNCFSFLKYIGYLKKVNFLYKPFYEYAYINCQTQTSVPRKTPVVHP